jgi:hypothetical protein
MVQVNPVFFAHSIEVDEDEAAFLRQQGLLREEKPEQKKDVTPAAKAAPAKEQP